MSKENVTHVTKQSAPWMMIMAVLFIVLKVSGSVSWPWWVVLLPLWLGPAVYLTIIAVVAVFGLLFVLLAAIGAAITKS